MRRLSEKATAVHVLMCASAEDLHGEFTPTVLEVALDEFGLSPRITVRITRLRTAARLSTYGYGEACVEAAYRLIESSPTLRREWFGEK